MSLRRKIKRKNPTCLKLVQYFTDNQATTSPAKFARDTQIAKSTMSRIMSGERPPTLRQAARIEKETGIPAIDWAK